MVEVFTQEPQAVDPLARSAQVHTLHPAPCTLHPAPCTLHPAPCTLNFGRARLLCQGEPFNALNEWKTLNPQPSTPKPDTQPSNPLNPNPSTLGGARLGGARPHETARGAATDPARP